MGKLLICVTSVLQKANTVNSNGRIYPMEDFGQMIIKDIHKIKMDDETEVEQFAATFYFTEENLKDLITLLDIALAHPKTGFHPRIAKLKTFRSQLKNSLKDK